jgi:hypothetical protein
MSWDHTTRWTAIENPDTGLVMVVVPASGKRSVHAIDMGDYGAHVIVREDVDVPASEIVEERAYFILAESIEKARMYVDLV